MAISTNLSEMSKNSYNNLEIILKRMYEKIFRKISDFKVTELEILKTMDCYLQALLIKVAVADREFHFEEIKFIKDITQYGNIFNDVDIMEFCNCNEETRGYLEEVAGSYLDEVPVGFQMAASVDESSEGKTDCCYIIMDSIMVIVDNFAMIDSIATKNEKKALSEGLKAVVKYLKLKKIKWTD